MQNSYERIPDTLLGQFFVSMTGEMKAEFFSSMACALVEQELAAAGVTYRTTILKSKKRGLVYVITIYNEGE
jgi:hypothetical protein